MSKSKRIILHTGSNKGDPQSQLREAIERIEVLIGPVVQQSSVYETEAWGKSDQPNFYNQALEVNSDYEPQKVLELIHEIENEMGRRREEKWGERVIDIDIIFYEDEVLKTEKLTLPHPYMHQRNFVLIPVMEIAPEFVHPELGETVEELYFRSQDTLEVIMLEKE